uniref:Neurotransmitter-gated ion-channel ligand-binding domain-containing protein n=1 Tax=Romanomermis culicivorax TaxID=13658 RepID=A0A915JV20_ROMCU
MLVLLLCCSFPILFRAEVLDTYFRTVYVGDGESGRILRQILRNYDPYVRPKPPGGGPTKLEIWIQAMNMMWRNDYFYLKGAYNERWVDERLKFKTKSGGPEEITLDANEVKEFIWQPEPIFIKHHKHTVFGRGLLTIFSNGTVHHKNLDTAVMYLKKSANDQKSFDGTFTATDFGNDKNDVTYKCNPQGCILYQNDDLAKKVKNFNYWSTFRKIDDREYEIVNFNLTFVPKS